MSDFTRNKLRGGFQGQQDILQILENLPDGLFLIDTHGTITFFNRAAEQITGVAASRALGMLCSQVLRSSACESACPLKGTAGSEKDLYSREFTVSTEDGKRIPLICSFFRLMGSDGEMKGGAEIFVDISEQRRLENALRLSDRKYQRIFEGSKDMILIISKNGSIEDVNQAGVELLGYGSKEELLALRSVEDVYENPKHWHVFKKQIQRDGFFRDFEAGFRKKDGTRLHCLLSGTADRAKDGGIIGYESIAKDITARMDAIRSFRKRHWELWVLNSVAFAMNKARHLDEILETALKKVLEVLKLSSGGIFLIDHDKSDFSLRVQIGLSKGDGAPTPRIVFNDEPLMKSLLKRDLTLDPEPIFPPFKAALKHGDSDRSMELTCFLITAKNRASGFLAFVVPPERDLTTGQDYHLLGSLGNFLGGAIENARLLQAVRENREDLKRLTARLFHSQEEERRRIARELHDEAGQALTGIGFTLETIEKGLAAGDRGVSRLISEAKKQINRTYQEVRRMSYSLHPALLTDLGLEPALESYLSSVSRSTGLDIDFRMVGFEDRVDPGIETVLYRLSQEALTNTLRHARAEHFRLSIIKGFPKIIFLAEDDGVGFVTGQFDQPRHGLGLLSMKERAAMLGGDFSLRSSPREGTRIRIEIPVTEESHG
ncbi:MAG: PAS domain S-box protein [Deltaproteobacteria bacterium]|nr:PAS domain S-box protein [Deltaproteobacteria bacterium]MBW2049541.1 PAS domain S-box protein [Deltaproteobacteria bacterium]MBW2112201.1 PAS domain S-box protein [Deltaproteobacteria bacterium]MBW2354295.1 PAS domain S-box protein [Deltaproteobacteria bacterium]